MKLKNFFFPKIKKFFEFNIFIEKRFKHLHQQKEKLEKKLKKTKKPSKRMLEAHNDFDILEEENVADILQEEYLKDEIYLSPLNADVKLEEFDVVY